MEQTKNTLKTETRDLLFATKSNFYAAEAWRYSDYNAAGDHYYAAEICIRHRDGQQHEKSWFRAVSARDLATLINQVADKLSVSCSEYKLDV